MKNSFLILSVVLFSCGTGTNKIQEEDKALEVQKIEEMADFEVNSSIVNELFVVENHDQSKYPFKQVETQSVDLNGDGKNDKINLYIIENWGDPGNFQKIEVLITQGGSYEFLNYGGWVTFNQNYSVPQQVSDQNTLNSENILLIDATPNSKLIMIFGWVYASEPGLMTIINPATGDILFNKEWELQSMSDTNSDSKLELRGASYFDGAVELLDFGTPKLELKSE
ncbi:MAG: hypothetical protein OCD76_20960 [Reichenbachiella sp.]